MLCRYLILVLTLSFFLHNLSFTVKTNSVPFWRLSLQSFRSTVPYSIFSQFSKHFHLICNCSLTLKMLYKLYMWFKENLFPWKSCNFNIKFHVDFWMFLKLRISAFYFNPLKSFPQKILLDYPFTFLTMLFPHLGSASRVPSQDQKTEQSEVMGWCCIQMSTGREFKN